MSDAAQVVEDVVECRVGLLTCLGNRQQHSHTSDVAQHTPAEA